MKNVGNSSRGRCQESRKFSRHPCRPYRAHCAVIFAIAQLSCYDCLSTALSIARCCCTFIVAVSVVGCELLAPVVKNLLKFDIPFVTITSSAGVACVKPDFYAVCSSIQRFLHNSKHCFQIRRPGDRSQTFAQSIITSHNRKTQLEK